MRRATHFLAVLYAVLALGLLRCAVISYQAEAWGYTAFFAAASIGASLAIVHASWLLDEHRYVLAQLDAATRPRRITTAQDDQVAIALAAACCEIWWATAGAEHDPDHCTRKDHHA
ncbi:hypothetical protein [Streptomyces sp. NPDC001658]